MILNLRMTDEVAVGLRDIVACGCSYRVDATIGENEDRIVRVNVMWHGAVVAISERRVAREYMFGAASLDAIQAAIDDAYASAAWEASVKAQRWTKAHNGGAAGPKPGLVDPDRAARVLYAAVIIAAAIAALLILATSSHAATAPPPDPGTARPVKIGPRRAALDVKRWERKVNYGTRLDHLTTWCAYRGHYRTVCTATFDVTLDEQTTDLRDRFRCYGSTAHEGDRWFAGPPARAWVDTKGVGGNVCVVEEEYHVREPYAGPVRVIRKIDPYRGT